MIEEFLSDLLSAYVQFHPHNFAVYHVNAIVERTFLKNSVILTGDRVFKNVDADTTFAHQTHLLSKRG